ETALGHRGVERARDVGGRVDQRTVEIEEIEWRVHATVRVPIIVDSGWLVPMSEAAKKVNDRRPPAADDAASRRHHVPPITMRETQSGVTLQPVYRPEDLAPGWAYPEKLGDPGRYPFTRGPHESMYRGK